MIKILVLVFQLGQISLILILLSIIDDNQFKLRIILRQHGRQTSPEILRFVVRAN